MLATWIFGSLFFVFIICFIIYILAADTDQSQSALGEMGIDKPSTSVPALDNGQYRISRDYQVIFSPRVFVNYPFGIKIVFPKSKISEPAILKSAESNGNPRSNVQRGLRENEYYGWPQSALEDPELTVVGGHVEFESKRIEPVIRVELKSARESFQAIKAVDECVLKRDEDAVCSFWLNPLKSEAGSLAISVSQPAESVGPAGSEEDKDELAAIRLTVPVTFFPIVLR